MEPGEPCNNPVTSYTRSDRLWRGDQGRAVEEARSRSAHFRVRAPPRGAQTLGGSNGLKCFTFVFVFDFLHASLPSSASSPGRGKLPLEPAPFALCLPFFFNSEDRRSGTKSLQRGGNSISRRKTLPSFTEFDVCLKKKKNGGQFERKARTLYV